MTERTSLERNEMTGYILLSMGCIRRDVSTVATQQAEETQDVLTDILFVNRGHVVLDCSIDEFESRYVQLMVRPDTLADARALGPIHERHLTGHSVLLFGRDHRERLATIGDVRTPSIADLFCAVVKEPDRPATRIGLMNISPTAAPGFSVHPEGPAPTQGAGSHPGEPHD